MNIYQFENLFSQLFFCNKRLIKNAGKIDIELVENGKYQEILAYDKNKKVGLMEYAVNKDTETIYVNIVQVMEEYKNSNIALKLFKKFHQIYKEKYWGWNIEAQFYNHELAGFFDKAVEKGWFPEGVNKTKIVDVKDIEDVSYEEWAKDADEFHFGINRLVDLNDLPEPFLRVNNDEKDFFGSGVIYKNLNENEIKKLTDGANEYYYIEKEFIKVLLDGEDIYYSFDENVISYLPEYISCKMISYVDFFSSTPEIITTNIDLIEKYANKIADFLGTENVKIYIVDGQETISNVEYARPTGSYSIFDLSLLREREFDIKNRYDKVGGRLSGKINKKV